MEPLRSIEEAIRNKLHVAAGPALHDRVLARVRHAQEQSNETAPAPEPVTRRMIMRSPSTKLAAAMVLAAGMTAGVLSLLEGPWLHVPSESAVSQEPRLPGDPQAQMLALRKMAATGDVKGLATVLSEGPFESKLVAANFLAKMAPMPALEVVSMHAVGELRADRQGGALRLYSTRYPDWLELADSKLIVHSGTGQQPATMVRLTLDREGNESHWHARQMEMANLREERAGLEKRLAGHTTIPTDVNQLRQRLDNYSEILDLIDGGIYASAANGGLRLEDRVYHREADLFPSDSGVRAEWHGDTVDANSITLLHALAPVRTEGPPTPPAGWRRRFDAVYSLAEGEVLRWVRTPFIPERQYYTQELHYYSGTKNPPPPLYMSFRWDGTLHQGALAMHECGLGSVLAELGTELGLRGYEISGPMELLQLRLGGDWIARTNTSLAQRFRALEDVLERELGQRIRVVHQIAEREVIVVRGRYERRPLEGHEGTDLIYLFAGAAPDQTTIIGRGAYESLAKLLDRVGERFNRPILLETQGFDGVSVWYQPCLSFETWVRGPEPKEPFPIHGQEKLNPVLANLTKQTSLEFAREKRPFATWFVIENQEPNDPNAGSPPPR